MAQGESPSEASPLTLRDVQRVNLLLAQLVKDQASPQLWNFLSVAESHFHGKASHEEVGEAREEVWALLTSRTCGTGASEAALMHFVLMCLDLDSGASPISQLREQGKRASAAGAEDGAVRACLVDAGLRCSESS